MYYSLNDVNLITNIINQYTKIFSGYFSQFLNWGRWLFYGFGAIALVWICLWNAFDKHSISDSMPEFLKEFFMISFFYTLMVNAAPWLSSIVDTAQSMSQQLIQTQIDPASIIQQGLTIANQILNPMKNSGVINLNLGATLILITYLITLAFFIAVAINLAITLLMTTFFISLSGILLAFGTFSFTRNIARRTLDTVIAYSFKLLSLYLVLYAGEDIFNQLSNYLPKDKVETFDIYVWTLSATFLFWASSYFLPKQILKLFSNAIQEHNGNNFNSTYFLSDIHSPERMSISENKLFVAENYTSSPLNIPENSKPFLSKPRERQ